MASLSASNHVARVLSVANHVAGVDACFADCRLLAAVPGQSQARSRPPRARRRH